jgi:hypothetical protein
MKASPGLPPPGGVFLLVRELEREPYPPSFPDVQLHIGESMLPIVVMDSGLAHRAPPNDGEILSTAA